MLHKRGRLLARSPATPNRSARTKEGGCWLSSLLTHEWRRYFELQTTLPGGGSGGVSVLEVSAWNDEEGQEEDDGAVDDEAGGAKAKAAPALPPAAVFDRRTVADAVALAGKVGSVASSSL